MILSEKKSLKSAWKNHNAFFCLVSNSLCLVQFSLSEQMEELFCLVFTDQTTVRYQIEMRQRYRDYISIIFFLIEIWIEIFGLENAIEIWAKWKSSKKIFLNEWKKCSGVSEWTSKSHPSYHLLHFWVFPLKLIFLLLYGRNVCLFFSCFLHVGFSKNAKNRSESRL